MPERDAQEVASSGRFLLATDVDGTLLTRDYRLLPEVKAAVQHVRSNGIAVMLATARGPAALDIVLNDLGAVDFAICFGGALLLAWRDGQWQRAHPDTSTIEEANVANVTEIARGLRLGVAAYIETGAHIDAVNPGFEREFSHTGEPVFVSQLTSVSQPVFKMLAISGLERVADLETLRHRLPEALYGVYSHANYLEIMPRGVSKGAALTAFCQSLGIDRDSVVAVGDADNDISMFEAAGRSASMPDSTPAARLAADWTAKSGSSALAAILDHYATSLWRIPAPSAAWRGSTEEESNAG